MTSRIPTHGEHPPERITKRICFILNNITEHNLQRQADEVMSLLPYHFMNWFAEFIINRVASEPNLVNLYAEFVLLASDHQNNFRSHILHLLTREIDTLLQSGRLQPCNGKALKHFGAFLGRLTLAKGIRLGVDIKSLIYVAFKNRPDSLDYIVPFIAELLKTIKESHSIKTTDHWVTEILQVAKELHHITNKLTIQFEIELLFSFLQRDMNEINSAFYLRRIK
uniref:CCR4-NOT transcription complex subunit 1 n=1 Tax=Schistocephalus solidus TaxID=70667 RepID=A0A0X3QHL8_SCHSO